MGLVWTHRVSVVLFCTCLSTAIAINVFGDLSFSVGNIDIGLARLRNPLLFAALAGLVAMATSRNIKVPLRAIWGLFRSHNIPFYYAVLAIAAFLISLGPVIRLKQTMLIDGPYMLLYDYVPGFKGIRVPSRMALIVVYAMAVLAGYAFVWIATRMRRRWMRGLFLCVLATWICTENLCIPNKYKPVDPQPAASHAWLAAQDGDFAIIEFPMYPPNIAQREAVYVFDSTHHWKKLVNGYSGFFPPATAPIKHIMSDFPSDESIALLRRLDVRYAVIHWWRMGPGFVDRVQASLQKHSGELAVRFERDRRCIVEILGDALPPPPQPPLNEIPQTEVSVTAMGRQDIAALAIDGDITTRWSDDDTRAKTTWLELDVDTECSLARVTLSTVVEPHNFPWHPLFQTSCDRENWTDITDRYDRVEFVMDCIQNPTAPTMTFNFEPRTTRYIRFRHDGSDHVYRWAIAEVRAYEAVP